MSTMTNITVKKNDGTTDQIWTGVQGSGGDRSPAIWRNQSVGPANSFMPEFTLTSRPNSDGQVRRLDGKIDWKQFATDPYGVTRRVSVANIQFSIGVPQGMPAADVNEFASQSTNLLASALIKGCIKEGFAPV